MNSIVKKDNQIIQASYNLSLHEQQCLLYCLTQIHTEDKEPPKEFTIQAKEFAALFGIQPHKSYEALKGVAETLFERYVQIGTLKTRWISDIDYTDGEGKIKLGIAPKIAPYLLQLKREFTTYDIRHTSGFSSKYSIRLYEWVIQWKNADKKQVEVFITTLRDRLMLGGKYTQIKDLRIRVINPAVADINEHSDINLNYKMVKSGRKFIAVQFNFSTKNKKRKQITEKELSERAKPGESRQEAMSRIKKLKEPLL